MHPTLLSKAMLIAVFASPALIAAGPPSTPDDLARQINERIETLQSLRAERRRRNQIHKSQREAVASVIESLGANLANTNEELARQSQALDALERQLDMHSQRIERARDWITSAARAVGSVAASYADRIEAGPPIEREARAEPFTSATAVLGGEWRVDEAESAIIAVFEQAGDDVAAGRSVELANTPILLEDGERREHAWRLRLGWVDAMFISEEGLTVGLWSGSPDQPWRLDLPKALAADVQTVFQIARERRPPALAPTPVPVPLGGHPRNVKETDQP